MRTLSCTALKCVYPTIVSCFTCPLVKSKITGSNSDFLSNGKKKPKSKKILSDWSQPSLIGRL